jgi:pyruvate kinase
MLIATLPSLHNRELVEEIFSNPLVGGVRYNIGVRAKHSPSDTVYNLNKLSEEYGKKLWIDLKGRQLRITKWADPHYGDIEMNRKITTTLPAKVYFRGDKNVYTLDDYSENKLYIYPDPYTALGAGQALNIISDNLEIVGDYLVQKDIDFIEASAEIGIHDYMLSFVERQSDAEDLIAIDPNAKPVLKIESVKGLEFVKNTYDGKNQLVAARDDLSVNLEKDDTKIQDALAAILSKDRDAIAASKIFESLKYGIPEDGKDITNLLKMGYTNFMLDDTISQNYFKQAMSLWSPLGD